MDYVILGGAKSQHDWVTFTQTFRGCLAHQSHTLSEIIRMRVQGSPSSRQTPASVAEPSWGCFRSCRAWDCPAPDPGLISFYPSWSSTLLWKSAFWHYSLSDIQKTLRTFIEWTCNSECVSKNMCPFSVFLALSHSPQPDILESALTPRDSTFLKIKTTPLSIGNRWLTTGLTFLYLLGPRNIPSFGAFSSSPEFYSASASTQHCFRHKAYTH